MTPTESHSQVTGHEDPPPPPFPLVPGQVLAGRYRIDRFLGEGGMGTVYQATHLHLDHPLAVKVLRRNNGRSSAAARERFRQEAKVAISMDHPNLVRVFDYGAEAPDFLVMELIDGTSVDWVLRTGGRLKATTALRIAADILSALGCLHEGGIVHRDIKPANVLIRRHDLRVKLSDFGLALDLSTLGQEAGGLHGTPAYMGPEVVAGQDPSFAADVFAAGVALFQMLTGQLPWRGETLRDLWKNMATLPPRLPSELGIELSQDIVWFLLRCLANRPQDRFASGAEAAVALCNLQSARKGGDSEGRLFRNRLALVLPDSALAGVLLPALQGAGLLDPVLAVDRPDSPHLAAFLGQVDALLLDPESGGVVEVEKLLAASLRDRGDRTLVLITPSRRHGQILARFSAPWRQRLEKAFVIHTDQALSQLVPLVQELAGNVLFGEGQAGQSHAPRTPPPRDKDRAIP